jgi:hypothetical protein
MPQKEHPQSTGVPVALQKRQGVFGAVAASRPNPLQKQMNLTVVPVILPAQPAHKQLSTIPSEEPSSVSEPVNGCPAIREPLLVRETCLEN